MVDDRPAGGRAVVAVTGDDPADDDRVSGVAVEVARALRGEVTTVNTRELGDARASGVLARLGRPSAAVGVLAGDLSSKSPMWQVMREATKPVVIVPPGLYVPPASTISRVLVPLDGTPESTDAVSETILLFAGAGTEIVALHVFDEATVPPFWDQVGHARRGWEEEFRARFCAPECGRIELRAGTPGEHVVDVASAEAVDLIAMGWSQRLDAGRALTVRHTIREASVPVMLVPLVGQGANAGRGRARRRSSTAR